MAIEIVDFSLEKWWIFPWQNVSLPEGNSTHTVKSGGHFQKPGWHRAAPDRCGELRLARPLFCGLRDEWHSFKGGFISMDWFKGKSTGNHRFSH